MHRPESQQNGNDQKQDKGGDDDSGIVTRVDFHGGFDQA
jgi:hypothetical protein